MLYICKKIDHCDTQNFKYLLFSMELQGKTGRAFIQFTSQNYRKSTSDKLYCLLLSIFENQIIQDKNHGNAN